MYPLVQRMDCFIAAHLENSFIFTSENAHEVFSEIILRFQEFSRYTIFISTEGFPGGREGFEIAADLIFSFGDRFFINLRPGFLYSNYQFKEIGVRLQYPTSKAWNTCVVIYINEVVFCITYFVFY